MVKMSFFSRGEQSGLLGSPSKRLPSRKDGKEVIVVFEGLVVVVTEGIDRDRLDGLVLDVGVNSNPRIFMFSMDSFPFSG